MRGIGGLAALQMAGIPRPLSYAPLPMGGAGIHKRFSAAPAPLILDSSGPSGVVNTTWLTITPASKKRGAVYDVTWRQLAGLPGQVVRDGPLRNYFSHTLPSNSAFPFSWRATVYNQFGEGAELDVAFSLTRYEPIPALGGSASPSGSTTFVNVDPVTRLGRCYFSASGSGGVPPYTYDWGGGFEPNSASNYADIHLPAGAPSGITFNPGCTIKDSIGQTKVVGAGPFFVYEGPPM